MHLEEHSHCFLHCFGVKTLSGAPPLMNEGDGARYACEDRVARRAGVGFILRYPELVCTKLRARLDGGSVLTLLAILSPATHAIWIQLKAGDLIDRV